VSVGPAGRAGLPSPLPSPSAPSLPFGHNRSQMREVMRLLHERSVHLDLRRLARERSGSALLRHVGRLADALQVPVGDARRLGDEREQGHPSAAAWAGQNVEPKLRLRSSAHGQYAPRRGPAGISAMFFRATTAGFGARRARTLLADASTPRTERYDALCDPRRGTSVARAPTPRDGWAATADPSPRPPCRSSRAS